MSPFTQDGCVVCCCVCCTHCQVHGLQPPSRTFQQATSPWQRPAGHARLAGGPLLTRCCSSSNIFWQWWRAGPEGFWAPEATNCGSLGRCWNGRAVVGMLQGARAEPLVLVAPEDVRSL